MQGKKSCTSTTRYHSISTPFCHGLAEGSRAADAPAAGADASVSMHMCHSCGPPQGTLCMLTHSRAAAAAQCISEGPSLLPPPLLLSLSSFSPTLSNHHSPSSPFTAVLKRNSIQHWTQRRGQRQAQAARRWGNAEDTMQRGQHCVGAAYLHCIVPSVSLSSYLQLHIWHPPLDSLPCLLSPPSLPPSLQRRRCCGPAHTAELCNSMKYMQECCGGSQRQCSPG